MSDECRCDLYRGDGVKEHYVGCPALDAKHEAAPTVERERERERKIDELWCESYHTVGTDECGENMMFKQDALDCMRSIADWERASVLSGDGAVSRDSLGDRMKSQYEDRTRYMLPRRTYTIVRLDGRAFHTFTRGMRKPYDTNFMNAMDRTAAHLCREMMGAQLAYVQSDEISILLTDFAKPETEAWFDGNLQKICSLSAALATAFFNKELSGMNQMPIFDSRVFTIPDHIEVENYFIWRQKDAERNSVQMLAQHYASHKELHGKSIPEQHDIIHAHGDNWNNHPVRFKRGGAVAYDPNPAMRCWRIGDPPIFTADRDFLQKLIPRIWDEPVQKTDNQK